MKNIKKAIQTIADFITEIQVEHMRKQVLYRNLEGLTDPTFLDRATAGEKHV